MKRIGEPVCKSEMAVELVGSVIPCMNHKRAYPRNFGVHFTHSECVKSDDCALPMSHIGLGAVRLLVCQSIAAQKNVQELRPTVKSIDAMIAAEFFNLEWIPLSTGLSKNPGSFSKRRMRGKSRGGASSAARNFSHCSAFKVKTHRSAKASSAFSRVLCSTKSLTLRCFACAAANSRCFACGVRRRSRQH